MATDYATKDELKARVSVPAGSTVSDTLLQQLLEASAYIVDRVSRNPVGFDRLPQGKVAFSATTEETRYFDDTMTGILDIDDLLTITTLLRDSREITSDYYALEPYNRGTGPATRILLRSDAKLENTVLVPTSWYGYPKRGMGIRMIAVTGTWGYCTAGNRPAVIKEATLTQAERLYERSGMNPTDILAGYRDPYKAIDPLVQAMLLPVTFYPRVQYGSINN